METRELGSSGIQVSVVGLGCNNLGRRDAPTEDERGAADVVSAALDAGITLFDTADMYGKEWGLSERLLGKALGRHRDDAVIATKFGHRDGKAPDLPADLAKGSRAYVRAAVEQSLRRLGTDYIDLYQMHTPDPSTPIEETLGALQELVTEGKVRAIGCSNFDGEQLRAADAAADRLGLAPFVTVQNEYSLLERGIERDVLPAAGELGVSVLPYFPLANGLLTGKFTRDRIPADTRIGRQKRDLHEQAPWDRIEAYAAFCEERGITMVEASFGWLLARPEIASVIAGATTRRQVVQNAATGAGWRPDAAELAAIDDIFPPAAG